MAGPAPAPHVAVPEGIPGIPSLFAFHPTTAEPLLALADAVLRGPSPLSPGERELIAASVSHANGCEFCATSHCSFAAAQLDGGHDLVAAVVADPASASISPMLRALLTVAEEVRAKVAPVSDEAIAAARAAGADDAAIHDTVLVAAAFSMFNRYVDGLRTWSPTADPRAYDDRARTIAERGYLADRV